MFFFVSVYTRVKSAQTSLKRGSLRVCESPHGNCPHPAAPGPDVNNPNRLRRLREDSCEADMPPAGTRATQTIPSAGIQQASSGTGLPPPVFTPSLHFSLPLLHPIVSLSPPTPSQLLAPLRPSFSLSPVLCFSFQWRRELSLLGLRVLVKH